MDVLEVFKLEDEFDNQRLEAHSEMKAIKERLTKLESMEIEYQEMLIKGDTKEMQTKQNETESRIQENDVLYALHENYASLLSEPFEMVVGQLIEMHFA